MTPTAWIALASSMLVLSPASAQESFEPGPDSQPQAGVPSGRIEGPFSFDTSRVYPGTTRRYWIYVPAQYQPTQPAALLVVQDGLGRAEEWKLPVVLDNLIHRGEVPVTIGVFVDPGEVKAPREGAQPRFNRSFEYDAMGDRYARFLIDELLPEVGRRYTLSRDPSDHAIAGASSGGICAFTVAWERPDAFRRVLSTIGTYVGLRGGDAYPTLVRKSEPRPIRVFLEDGSRDLNLYAGDWWVANQDMLSALEWAGYDVAHAWGEGGGHDGRHAAAILPDALRWLWRGHPEPIRVAGPGPERRVQPWLDGEAWSRVDGLSEHVTSVAADAQGGLLVADADAEGPRILRLAPDGAVAGFASPGATPSDLAWGADERLYACQAEARRIVRFGATGAEEPFLEDAACGELLTLPGGLYFTEPEAGRVVFADSRGERREVAELEGRPLGLASSPDHTLLDVADADGRFVYSFQLQPDGSLLHAQEYGWLHRRDAASGSGARGMAMDVLGRPWVATPLGVQVLDQLGRVNAILASPGACALRDLAFAGPALDVLYATCDGILYRRRVNATGFRSAGPPSEPPRPRL